MEGGEKCILKRDPEVNIENQLQHFGKKTSLGIFFFKTFPLSEHLSLFNFQFNQVGIAKLSIWSQWKSETFLVMFVHIGRKGKQWLIKIYPTAQLFPGAVMFRVIFYILGLQ